MFIIFILTMFCILALLFIKTTKTMSKTAEQLVKDAETNAHTIFDAEKYKKDGVYYPALYGSVSIHLAMKLERALKTLENIEKLNNRINKHGLTNHSLEEAGNMAAATLKQIK